MDAESSKDLLRPAKVAKMLDVSPSTVYYWISTGRIEGVKLPGKTLRIRRSAVENAQKSTMN